jgi:hypothetical protein
MGIVRVPGIPVSSLEACASRVAAIAGSSAPRTGMKQTTVNQANVRNNAIRFIVFTPDISNIAFHLCTKPNGRCSDEKQYRADPRDRKANLQED